MKKWKGGKNLVFFSCVFGWKSESERIGRKHFCLVRKKKKKIKNVVYINWNRFIYIH